MTPLDCPNCKGKGTVLERGNPLPDEPDIEVEYVCIPCGGSGIDPELVETGAPGLREFPQLRGSGDVWLVDPREITKAVLAAVVAYWKEKE